MPSQVEQVKNMLGCQGLSRDECQREVDILTLTAGINDIGFAGILTTLMLSNTGPDFLFDATKEIEQAANDGNWDPVVDRLNTKDESDAFWGLSVLSPIFLIEHRLAGELGFRLLTDLTGDSAGLADPFKTEKRLKSLPEIGLNHLRSEDGPLDKLDHAIRRDLPVKQIIVAEYPSAAKKLIDGIPVACSSLLSDLSSTVSIDSKELIVSERINEGLNTAVRDAALRNGWDFVGGIADRFANGHGYCAENPPGYVTQPDGTRQVEWPGPKGIRWLQQGVESANLQGPLHGPINTTGLMHPNEWGHVAVCEEVVKIIGGVKPRGCLARIGNPPGGELSGRVSGAEQFESADSISARDFVITDTGVVTFRACNDIRLHETFLVMEGSVFRAEITREVCPQGDADAGGLG